MDEEEFEWKFYEKGSRLGKGAYGSVKKYTLQDVHHKKDLPKVVAVKKLTQEQHNPVAELDMCKKLKHKNIVGYHGHFTKDGYLYLVLELCLGSIKDFKKKWARVTPKEVSFVMKQVLEGLVFLHNLGIIHRDLKPGNILVTKVPEDAQWATVKLEDLIFKLADFGLSRELKDVNFPDKSQSMSRVGTPKYMAPEVIDPPKYNAKADIYSAAVVACELFRGSNSNNSNVGYNADRAKEDQVLKTYPIFLDFLLKQLHPDKHQRPSAKELLEHPFIRGPRIDLGKIRGLTQKIDGKIREIFFLPSSNYLVVIVHRTFLDRYRVLTADLTEGPRNVIKVIKDCITDANYGGCLSNGKNVAICAESTVHIWDGAELGKSHKPQWMIPGISKLLAMSSNVWVAGVADHEGTTSVGVFHKDQETPQPSLTFPSESLEAKNVGFCGSMSGEELPVHLVIANGNELLDTNISSGIQRALELDLKVAEVLTIPSRDGRDDLLFLLISLGNLGLKLFSYCLTDMSLTEISNIDGLNGSAVHPLQATITKETLFAIMANSPNAESGTLVSKILTQGRSSRDCKILAEDVSCFCCLEENLGMMKILAVKDGNNIVALDIV